MTTKRDRYIALLRGINVGGHSIIKMADLKTCFEEIGLGDVKTYIQSGNVVFTSTSGDENSLAKKIETAVEKTFKIPVRTLVLSAKQVEEVVEKAPSGFGSKPEEYRYDVIFHFPPLTPKESIKEMPIKEGVDEVHAGKYVLYFSRLIKKATQSKLSKIVGTPMYKEMTIRNWNTTSKLVKMVEGL